MHGILRFVSADPVCVIAVQGTAVSVKLCARVPQLEVRSHEVTAILRVNRLLLLRLSQAC